MPGGGRADAEPDVRRADGGAGLPGRAGHARQQPGEARGGAEGGLPEPHASPHQHSVHTELLHPPPAVGEGEPGGERRRRRNKRGRRSAIGPDRGNKGRRRPAGVYKDMDPPPPC